MRCFVLLALPVLCRCQQIEVVNTVAGDVDPRFYSAFFESEINFGGNGGVYAELIWNRDFEALGRGKQLSWARAGEPTSTTSFAEAKHSMWKRAEQAREEGTHEAQGLDPLEPPARPGDYNPWYLVGTGLGAGLSTGDAPFATNPNVMELTQADGSSGWLMNPGYWGIAYRTGVVYNLTFYAKSLQGVTDVRFELRCEGGGVAGGVAVPVTGSWAKHVVTLVPSVACSNGTFAVSPAQAGRVLLDSVSLFPGDAVAGLFRRDVIDMVVAMQPHMMRIPGGNYLEGTGPRTRWAWKNTIGLPEARAGHYNSAWGYWVTDGLGARELLIFAQVTKTVPLMSIFTGYYLGAKTYTPLNESQGYAQDAVDLLEYSNGDSTTVWGQRRIADGSTEPFGLKDLEVGNEENLYDPATPNFPGHYQLITSEVWKQHPDVYVVASGMCRGIETVNRTASCSPCVGGCGLAVQKCFSWDEHLYRTPQQLAHDSGLYDDYRDPGRCTTLAGGACPDVYILEYAASNTKLWDLESAISEAVFLVGNERNSDVVKATSFAPLLCNANAPSWNYNLITFNSSAVYGIPSYHMQKMFASAYGSDRLETHATGTLQGNVWNATSARSGDTVTVKIANFGPTAMQLPISFTSFGNITIARNVTLFGGGDPQGVNSLTNPHNVVAKVVRVDPVGSTVILDTPPYSAAVVTAQV